MRLNGNFSVGNVWTIIITLMALAVLWGSSQNRISNIERQLERKVDRELVEVKFEFIQSQLSDIKQLLEPIFQTSK
jgi:hypothetical protein